MNVAAALLAYGLVLAVVFPRLLTRSVLADRSPRLALLLWQGATVSFLASLLLAGVVLAVPSITLSGDLAELLNTCAMAIRAQYATPGGAATGVTGLILAASIALRVMCVLTAGAVRNHRARIAHREALTLVGYPNAALGITVVDHERVAAYCVPGRAHRIVLTSAALDSLTADQLRGVLAHERSHLRGHHHLALGFAASIAAAFPAVPLLRIGSSECARMVELLADDAAESACDRDVLAAALVTLASVSTPSVALAANGADITGRVSRMLRPARPLSKGAVVLLAALGLSMLAAPVAVAAAPALVVRDVTMCPFDANSTGYPEMASQES